MKVYFLKNDVSQFVIFPEPENLEDYFLAEVEDESELERKSAVVFKGEFRLVEKYPSEEHEWNGKSWVISKEKMTALLNEQRAEIWARIKQKRHDNLRGGVYVKSVGKWFHSNDESRQQYTFLRTLDKLPDNLMWKTMDNSFVQLTKAILDELSSQLVLDEQADFTNAERHKAMMEQAENPLDYDFGSGWTETFPEAINE